VTEPDLRRALPILARRGVPLLVHAEMFGAADSPAHAHSDRQPTAGANYAAYLGSRPATLELNAIRLMIRLAEEFRTRVHIVHLSSAEGVEAIAAARAAWVPITAETCPHYLTFAAGEIPAGATAFKCAPPIREAAHRRALWDGLASGTLDLIATDHSPAPPALKPPGDFSRAWGGIASMELSLPAVWTAYRAAVAQRRPRADDRQPAETVPASAGTAADPASHAADTSRGSSREPAAPEPPDDLESAGVVDLARWMSAAPAALAGLSEQKGRIAEGLDADLVVWDPETAFRVEPERLQQRHKLTPYAGRSLFGMVVTTFVRGERVWDKGRLIRAYGGRLL
jgi:allantoinase